MRCALPAALLPALLAVFTPLHRVEEGVKVPYQPVMIAGVRDPVFAYLVALARDDARGELSGTALDRLVEKSGRESRLPHALLHEVSRVAGATAELPARVRVAFSDPLDVPVPYSILGYHPGSLRASRELLFDEWFLGRMRLPDDPAGGRRYLEEVRLLVLRRGELQIDIDWWVDKLFGSKLDDTEVIALALARLDDRHLGIATGLNGSGRGRSGTFDLHADEIVFPSPSHLKFAGRTLRQRARRLLPGTTPSEFPSTNAAPRLPGGTDPSAALAKPRNSPAIPSASPPCSWARRAPAAADLHSWTETSE